MTKKSMRKALGETIKAEENAVENRFKQAETAFGKRYTEAATGRQGEATDRVVRDSFTMPTADYELISLLKERCLKSGVHATKSEIVRAGLVALEKLSIKELKGAIESLNKVKTGRPSAK